MSTLHIFDQAADGSLPLTSAVAGASASEDKVQGLKPIMLHWTRKAKNNVSRVIYYHQTHFLQNGDLVSLRPIVWETQCVNHIIIGAIHLNDTPGDITLNNDPPSDPKFVPLWREAFFLQRMGIKVLGMLGGAAAGTFKRLDGDQFEEYYSPLKDVIKTHRLDGLDLDVEETMSLDGIINLIDRLKADFGNNFLITLAPVADALCGGGNLSGFDYFDLEANRGDKIAWYNAQFYCGWGDITDTEFYDEIIRKGWSPSKVVVGLSTNSTTPGWVSLDDLTPVLVELKKKYPDFGGVDGWEYHNSLPGGKKRPWVWGSIMGAVLFEGFRLQRTAGGNWNGVLNDLYDFEKPYVV